MYPFKMNMTLLPLLRKIVVLVILKNVEWLMYPHFISLCNPKQLFWESWLQLEVQSVVTEKTDDNRTKTLDSTALCPSPYPREKWVFGQWFFILMIKTPTKSKTQDDFTQNTEAHGIILNKNVQISKSSHFILISINLIHHCLPFKKTNATESWLSNSEFIIKIGLRFKIVCLKK